MSNEYRLLKRHRHNKEWLTPGAVIALPDDLGKWLTEQGVVEPVVVPVPQMLMPDEFTIVTPATTEPLPIAPASTWAASSRWGCCGPKRR